MDGLVIGYFLIEWIGKLDRACFYTGSTAHAFILDDVPGLFGQGDFESSRFPFNPVNLSIGQDLYIGLPVDLDQFGCEYSHRAVVGGKRLIELGHMAADGRRFLHHIDFEARGGKIERCLNPADSAPHHHDITEFVASHAFYDLFNFFLFHLIIPKPNIVYILCIPATEPESTSTHHPGFPPEFIRRMRTGMKLVCKSLFYLVAG